MYVGRTRNGPPDPPCWNVAVNERITSTYSDYMNNETFVFYRKPNYYNIFNLPMTIIQI